ncbi:antibiotic biosynthesis monooxygenase family protein [Actinomycetospora chiangmaiensis]|uniref:antibiotic biosynthesis monooxygenase family protein n=1 Tax=Actinomycetospora chiangmaiensis TaxID=402650 RepID=UPI00037520E6|nr:antibiotic biosynthesis monooxygenase family protein [Actinomycetospora chiangmaiensis]
MLHPTSTITITAGTRCVTLINVFTVERGHQDELVDALDRATAEVFTGVPGFISANVHASLDGTRVVNYAQWASEEAYAAAMARPEVRRHIADAAARATSYDPTLAQVRAIHHADQE